MVDFYQPFTGRRSSSRHQVQKMTDSPIYLIVGDSLPIHTPEHTFDQGQKQDGRRPKTKKISDLFEDLLHDLVVDVVVGEHCLHIVQIVQGIDEPQQFPGIPFSHRHRG